MPLAGKWDSGPKPCPMYLWKLCGHPVFNTTATIVLTAVNVFHNPEIEAAVAAGFLPNTLTAFVQGVLHDWPIMFIISYVFAFFVTKAAIRIAKQAVGELKSPHSPQNQFQ